MDDELTFETSTGLRLQGATEAAIAAAQSLGLNEYSVKRGWQFKTNRYVVTGPQMPLTRMVEFVEKLRAELDGSPPIDF